jgi:hypothetical protein
MSAPADLESAAALVFAGSREDFIATRNRLAKAAKTAGDAALAGRITALAKPNQTAWAVDRVWWDAPELVRELFAAATELRATLASGAGPQTAEPARTRHRKAALAATQRAIEALGGNVGIPVRRRITTTLEALGALGRWPPPGPGCLSEDLDPPGFDATGAMPELGSAAFVPEAVANDGGAAIVAAETTVRLATARLETCRRQHDALVSAQRDANLRVEEAEAALARARLQHEACVDAAAATARDLDQRRAELEEAALAHAEASAALAALRGTP